MPLHQVAVVFLQNRSSQRLLAGVVHSTKTSILSGRKLESHSGLKLGGCQVASGDLRYSWATKIEIESPDGRLRYKI